MKMKHLKIYVILNNDNSDKS